MSYDVLTGSLYLSAMYPSGSIIANAVVTNDPGGWVICDGVGRINNGGMYDTLIALSIGTYNTNTKTYTPPNF